MQILYRLVKGELSNISYHSLVSYYSLASCHVHSYYVPSCHLLLCTVLSYSVSISICIPVSVCVCLSLSLSVSLLLSLSLSLSLLFFLYLSHYHFLFFPFLSLSSPIRSLQPKPIRKDEAKMRKFHGMILRYFSTISNPRVRTCRELNFIRFDMSWFIGDEERISVRWVGQFELFYFI